MTLLPPSFLSLPADFVRCLVIDHHPVALMTAVAIGATGVTAAFRIGAMVRLATISRVDLASSGISGKLWPAIAILTFAGSVWSTHFLAMLGYRPPAIVGFEPTLTVLSLVLVLLGAAGAILLLFRTVSWAQGSALRRRVGSAGAGLFLGSAVAAMHYVGMAGYDVPGRLSWDWPIIALSVAVGGALSALALMGVLSPRRWRRRTAPLIMLAAIVAIHFLGMTALHFTPDPLRQVAPGLLSPEALATLVAAASAATIIVSVLAAVAGRRIARVRREAEVRSTNFADAAVEGLLLVDAVNCITSANVSAAALVGRSRSDLVGTTVGNLIPGLDVTTLSPREERDALLLSESGTAIPIRLLARPLGASGAFPIVLALRDQREKLRQQAELQRLSSTDVLTGLPNRGALFTAIDERSRDFGERPSTLLLIDLTRFREINEALGQAVGDALICRTAERLQPLLPDGALLGRIGADIFGLLLPAGWAPPREMALAETLLDRLSRPAIVQGQVVDCTAAIGMASAPRDGRTAEELMRATELALSAAKRAGPGHILRFHPEMDRAMQSRRTLEQELRRAIARGELTLHYQPKYAADGRILHGAEALLRWRHPTLGQVSPALFVPVAEETGLIVDIGRWVLETAAREAADWPEPLTVAVNVSAVQLRDPAFPAQVEAVLATTGLAPHRLELELTESALLDEAGDAATLLGRLRSLGLKTALDDFGTGFSSLAYLSRFPFDRIKIDRSFTMALEEDEGARSIVRAVLMLGQAFGLAVTAEGVETEAQRAFVEREGGSEIQGWLVGKPMPADAFRALASAEPLTHAA